MSTQEFEVGAGAALSVKIQAGRVEVSEGPAGRITVEILTKNADGIEVSQTGDAVSVIDNRDGWVVRGSVRVAASVPAGTDVEIGSASATVDVEAPVGNLTCKTASGNVTFASVEDITVKTASGTVRGGIVSGSAEMKSASGNIRIDRLGSASVGVASGNVNLDDASGDLKVTSASGDIRVSHFRGDEANLKTVSGNVTIGLPTGISLDTDITTLTGSVRMPESRPIDLSDLGETVKRRVRFRAKTVSGNIRIDTFSH